MLHVWFVLVYNMRMSVSPLSLQSLIPCMPGQWTEPQMRRYPSLKMQPEFQNRIRLLRILAHTVVVLLKREGGGGREGWDLVTESQRVYIVTRSHGMILAPSARCIGQLLLWDNCELRASKPLLDLCESFQTCLDFSAYTMQSVLITPHIATNLMSVT